MTRTFSPHPTFPPQGEGVPFVFCDTVLIIPPLKRPFYTIFLFANRRVQNVVQSEADRSVFLPSTPLIKEQKMSEHDDVLAGQEILSIWARETMLNHKELYPDLSISPWVLIRRDLSVRAETCANANYPAVVQHRLAVDRPQCIHAPCTFGITKDIS